ncbi:Polysaccharide biosynthesis protein [uncultured Paludibacter sp.]|nr:Polysaccharide biosynthesis protein [uncultured Paludibacter sp.]
MTSSKREIKDVFYLMILQGISYLAPLIVFPYLMVTLGAEKFGYIGFSLAIVQYLMLFVDFGFNFSATKRIAQVQNDKEKVSEVFWSTIYAKLFLLLASLVILFVFAFVIPRFAIYSKTLLIMSLMVVGNTFSFVWLFQGLGKIRTISIISTVSKLLILPLTFLYVKKSDDYNLAAMIQASAYLFSGLLTVSVLLRNEYINLNVKTAKEKIVNELRLAYPVFVSTAASSVYTALFTIILGYFSNPVDVGKYTAAEKITRFLCMFIYLPITQSFYPKISSLALTSKVSAFKIIKKSLLFVVISMTFLFFVLFFFSRSLTIFLGKEYFGTTNLFKIMAIAPLLIASGGILGQLGLLAAGDEIDKKNFQNVYIMAAVIATLLVFVLVPKLKSLGASISLVITELVVFLGILWYYRRVFSYKMKK